MLLRDLSTELTELVNSDMLFTDLHIEQDMPVMAKTPAGWVELPGFMPATIEDLGSVISSMDQDWERNILVRAINRPINLSHWRLRVSAYIAHSGDKVVLSIRRLPLRPIPLEQTGLPQSVRLMADSPRGLILVVGSTGSGKSTTMAAIIDAINKSRNGHVVTIEDPIEYIHEREKCIFTPREIGVDVQTFDEGVRDAMRQRPDVIMIGEIRDADTAESALIAAESGHLVLASLHANSTVGAIQKMLSFASSSQYEARASSLAYSLVGAISQVLLPSVDRKGYVLASELLFNHKGQFAKDIRSPEAMRRTLDNREDGISRSIEEHLFELVSSNKISKAEALRATPSAQVRLYERLKS